MKHLFRVIAILVAIFCNTSAGFSQGFSSWYNPNDCQAVNFQFADGGSFSGYAFYQSNQLTKYTGTLTLTNGDRLQGDFSPSHNLIGTGLYYIKSQNSTIRVKSENGQLVQTDYWDGNSSSSAAPAPTYTSPSSSGSGSGYTNPATDSKALCRGCNGSGRCQHCHGSGWVNNNKSKCSLCHGTGTCVSCHGRGYVHL